MIADRLSNLAVAQGRDKPCPYGMRVVIDPILCESRGGVLSLATYFGGHS
jgi:hypothetical protein